MIELKALADIKLQDGEMLIISKDTFAYVEDKEGHTVRIFVRQKDPRDKRKRIWVEMDLEKVIDKISDYLKDSLDPKEFLREWLRTSLLPKEVLELEQRVEKKAAVRKRHCYRLDVYGKKGEPFPLWLVKTPWQ